MILEFPENSPGIHPPTAALTKILQAKGVINPFTHQPYNEALLFGIGGGIGVGYILFQFKHLPNPILVLGFRHLWNDAYAFLENLSRRLFLKVDFQDFEDEETAEDALRQTLEKQRLAIVWVDKAHLPYHQLPDDLKGLNTYQVAVYRRDQRTSYLFIDDLSRQLFEIREKTLTSARANISPSNFLMMSYIDAELLTPQELRGSIIEAIRECAGQLTQAMNHVGISNLTSWSDQLTDQQHQSGWPQAFREQKGLFSVLRTIYESIKHNGSDGFALRKIYADFLQEAAGILSNYALNAVAGQYLQLSNRWSTLADNALPSRIPVFDQVKNSLNKKYNAYRNHDFIAHEEISRNLSALEQKINADFPMDSDEVNQLFQRLSSQIKLIGELEKAAAYRLTEVTY